MYEQYSIYERQIENLEIEVNNLTRDCELFSKMAKEEHDKYRELAQSFSFVCKWVERAIWDDNINAEDAVNLLKHYPGMPWFDNSLNFKWDTSHKPYHDEIVKLCENG